MLSNNYCGIFVVVALCTSWSEAAVINPLEWQNESLQSFDTEEISPEVTLCSSNEVPNIYNTPEFYCDVDPESNPFYYQSDVPAKCRCAHGYLRLYNGDCVSEHDCVIALGCPHNEIPNLNNIWQATCDNDEDLFSMPTQKCLCPVGKMRNSDGTCTAQENCDIPILFY